MPESLIVKYCAPTLAGIKTANLFTCDFPNRESLYKEISARNQELKGKGIRLLILGYTKQGLSFICIVLQN
ncbi:MAG: DUF3793 family protein [Solobacterium sp.]|nr:DUF3793 family protein [Solobacterium sp.]